MSRYITPLWSFEKSRVDMIQGVEKDSGISRDISLIIAFSFTDATNERFLLTSPYV